MVFPFTNRISQPLARAATINETKPFNEEIWARMQRRSPKRNMTWKCLDVIITKGHLKERFGGIYSVREIYPNLSAEVAGYLNESNPLPLHDNDRLSNKRVKRGNEALAELLQVIDINVGIKFFGGGEISVSIADIRPTESVYLFAV